MYARGLESYSDGSVPCLLSDADSTMVSSLF